MTAMRCDEARPRLGALFDGELADGSGPDVLAHVEGCAECATEISDLSRLRSKLARVRVPAPASLRTRIEASLRQEEQSTRASPAGRMQDWLRRFRPSLLSAGMTVAACLVTALLTWSVVGRSFSEDRLVQEALTAHLRAIVQDHVVQVASSDGHTVKPWFAGRLEFSPVVKDLAPEGFPLVGGRIDFLGQERVAALVYRRRLHTVTLLMRPAASAEPIAVASTQINGYTVITWANGGTAYWMVSDLSRAELLQMQAML
jgi:anti-sigma factor RsiW